jgi:hypothetical protein
VLITIQLIQVHPHIIKAITRQWRMVGDPVDINAAVVCAPDIVYGITSGMFAAVGVGMKVATKRC